jgi:hypothetical protein
MSIGIWQPIAYNQVKKMDHRFCWNCYNFEDRRDIDGVVLCTKGHTPGTTCEDFVEREEELTEIRLNGRFCWTCCNFEDRRETDGALLCVKGHHPEGNCEDFADKEKKFRDITNNNRHERAIVKAILMANKNPKNHSSSLQNLILKLKNHAREVNV